MKMKLRVWILILIVTLCHLEPNDVAARHVVPDGYIHGVLPGSKVVFVPNEVLLSYYRGTNSPSGPAYNHGASSSAAPNTDRNGVLEIIFKEDEKNSTDDNYMFVVSDSLKEKYDQELNARLSEKMPAPGSVIIKHIHQSAPDSPGKKYRNHTSQDSADFVYFRDIKDEEIKRKIEDYIANLPKLSRKPRLELVSRERLMKYLKDLFEKCKRLNLGPTECQEKYKNYNDLITTTEAPCTRETPTFKRIFSLKDWKMKRIKTKMCFVFFSDKV